MNDFSKFFDALKAFQENNVKAINLMLDECFSFDDLKGPNNKTLLHYFALDPKEYDYTLLIDSFISLDHIDDSKNTALYYSENRVFFRKLLDNGASFIVGKSNELSSIRSIFVRDRSDLLQEFSYVYNSWVSNNIGKLISYSIDYGSVECLKALFKNDQIGFTNAFETSTKHMQNIMKKGNIPMLSFVLTSIHLPLDYFDFNPCPCPQIIDAIFSHYSEDDILDCFKIASGRVNAKAKAKIKQQSKDIFAQIPDQKNKEYIRKVVLSIDSWNESESCVVSSPLHYAAYKDDANAIKKFSCSYVDITDYEGKTPLFIATSCGNSNAAEALLKMGANGFKKCVGSSPIHEASKKNMKDIVSLIIANERNIDRLDDDLSTPLMCALEHGADDVAKILLEAGADVNAARNDGNTVSHIAALSNTPKEIVSIILSKGAQLQVLNKDKENPLLVGLKSKCREVGTFAAAMDNSFGITVEQLNLKCIWENVYVYNVLINEMNDFAVKNAKEILKLVVKNCLGKGFSSIILKLSEVISESAKLEVLKSSIFGDNNYTCPFIAGMYPSLITAQSEDNKESVLHWVAMQSPPCSDAIFRSLMRNIDQLVILNKNQENPLHYAVRARNVKFINTFLNIIRRETQEDKNIYTIQFSVDNLEQVEKAFYQKNKDGLTPLDIALVHQFNEISTCISEHYQHLIFQESITVKRMQQLFLSGIKGNVCNKNGLSLLSYTIQTAENEEEAHECVKIILEHGGDPTVKDSDGKRPSFYAAKKGYASVIQLLLFSGGILDEVSEFLKSFDNKIDDGIVELIHTHDQRASKIYELYESEVIYNNLIGLLVDNTDFIISEFPFSSSLIIAMRPIYRLSTALIKLLKPVCHRLSPQSCITPGLEKISMFSNCFYSYICVFNLLQTHIDEKIIQVLGKKPKNSNITFGDLMELPKKRFLECNELISTILRLTPDSHPDYNSLMISAREWKETAKKCLDELAVFASYNSIKKKKIKFTSTSRISSNNPHSKLLWVGEVTSKKVTIKDQTVKKIFDKTKDTIIMCIFDTIVWFSTSGKDNESLVFYSLCVGDIFFEVKDENEFTIFSEEGDINCSVPTQRIFDELRIAIMEIDKGFSYKDNQPRLIKCTYVLEEEDKFETQIMLFNCDSKDTAIFEFNSLFKEPLKKYRDGTTVMLNVTPLSDGMDVSYQTIKKTDL